VLALGSALLYGGVLAHTLVHSARAVPATGALGAAGAVLLALVLVRADADLLAWPLVCLSVAYGVALVVHGRAVDDVAPLVAAGLFLSAELASWSIDERLAIAADRAVVAARAVALGSLALVSLAVAALAVGLASAPTGSGLGWTMLGAASAVAIVGLAVALARRR